MSEYSCIYIKYVQIFRKLEEAYDQMAHPQKRTDMKKAVEAVLGRILEIKSWLVKLNKDIDSAGGPICLCAPHTTTMLRLNSSVFKPFTTNKKHVFSLKSNLKLSGENLSCVNRDGPATRSTSMTSSWI